MSTYIDGIGASQHIDSSGEIVDIKGLDISSLSIDGVINWEHLKDQPTQVVGKIIKAKKIFEEKDCEGEREKYFWLKSKAPFVYILAELLDEFTESAKHVAGILKYDEKNRGKNGRDVLGFSIEGSRLGEKKGMIVPRSIGRKVTLTCLPCNKMAIAEIVPEKPRKIRNLEDFFKTEPSVEIELLKTEDVISLESLRKNQPDPHHHANVLGITPMKKDVANLGNLANGSPGGLLMSEKAPSASTPKAPVKNVMTTPFKHPGHVMGRTSSGKDVMSHQRIHEYRGFSTKDHEDAAKMHYEHSQTAKDPKTGAHHLDRMKLHLQAAQTSARKDSRLKTGLAAKRNKLLNKSQTKPNQSPTAHNEANEKPAHQNTAPEKMEKAMDAGSGMAAPSQLVGGAALAKEKIEGQVLQKPYVSEAQRGWAHTAEGKKALGGEAAVREWDRASKGKKLPAHVSKKEKWLARAEEEYKNWEKREQFQEFMKKRMPHLTKGEIDAFGKTMLLKKSIEAEKALAKFSDALMAHEDILPGGLADKKKPEDFDQEQLAAGTKIEMEHTNNSKIAREIAMDHLTEDKDYYKKLKVIEKNEKIDNEHSHVGKVISRAGKYVVKKPNGEMHSLPNEQHGKILSGQNVKFGINEHNEAVLHPRHIHELKQYDKK